MKNFCQLLSLVVILFLASAFAAAQENALPPMQGEKAVDYLKQNDLYDSLAATVAANTVFTQQAKVEPNDGAAQDSFGYAVAISGDTAIVGSPRNTGGTGLQNRGAAYVYIRSGSTWNLQQKLTPSDGAATDQFGYAVAINGNTAVVGRYNTTTGQNRADGKVYVFTRSGTTWAETQTLVSNDIAQGDLFGNALAFENDTLVVGALNKNNGNNFFQGAVYVFTRAGAGSNFAQQQKLVATDGAANDFFGYSIAVSGDSVIVGAPGAPLTGVGKAYVFTRSGSTWTQQQKLTASDGAAGDAFGFSVAISGDTSVVGARLDDIGAVGDQGSAYVFARNGSTWTEQQKLLGVETTQRNDQFGSAVAIKGDTIAVGSPAHEFIGSIANHGAVYIFTRSGAAWTRTDKLVHNDPAPDAFGQALAFDGVSLLASAPSKNSARGAAYIFTARSVTGQTRLLSGVDLVNGSGYGDTVAISNDTALVGSLNWGMLLFSRVGDGWQFVRKLSVAGGANSNTWFSNGGAAIAGDQMFVGAPGAVVNGVNAAGAVYIFNRVGGNWTEGQRIDPPESTALQSFGSTIALSGDTLAVGAPNKTVGANQNQGAVYVYVRTGGTWTFQQKLTTSDGAAQDSFGQALAISGETIIAGAPSADVNGNINQGAAYVFTRSGSTWTQQPRLVGSTTNANDNFGFSIALENDTAVISAPFKEIGENFTAGIAYVFNRSGNVWSEQQQLSEGGGSDISSQFARSVALSGDRLVIGQPNFVDQSANLFNHGAVYVYQRAGSNWARRGRITAFDPEAGGQVGESVHVSGNLIIAGAPGKDFYGMTNVGAAYVFDLTQIRFGSSEFDFDGDGKADLSVFRGGNWYVSRSANNQFAAANFGLASDRVVPADYDGDGKTDIAVFRDGFWYFLYSATNQFGAIQFGATGDVPVPADYDGDGKADVAVFRSGNWYRMNSSTNQFFGVQFGIAGDKPVRGDFDGDGRADLAVVRGGNWYIQQSSNNQFRAQNWGFASDKFVPADYDGDGKTDLAVFRDGNWFIYQSSDNQFKAVNWGIASDVPVPADYDGDGKSDAAVFRGGNWYVLNSSNNAFRGEQFGIASDTPIPSVFVR